jgi:hypothetical protein
VGGASGRGAKARFTGRTGAEGGENYSRLFFAAFGTFQIAVVVRYFAVDFKFFAAGFTFIFVDGHNALLRMSLSLKRWFFRLNLSLS